MSGPEDFNALLRRRGQPAPSAQERHRALLETACRRQHVRDPDDVAALAELDGISDLETMEQRVREVVETRPLLLEHGDVDAGVSEPLPLPTYGGRGRQPSFNDIIRERLLEHRGW